MSDNIADKISEILEYSLTLWRRKDRKEPFFPSAYHINQALDEARKTLYDEPVGSTLTIAGIIVEREEHGYSVYARVGELDLGEK